MRYLNYSLEILVDNCPLSEYDEEANLDRPVSLPTSQVTYADGKYTCSTVSFASVRANTPFIIRASSPSSINVPMLASVYVDGIGDGTVCTLQGISRTFRGLYSAGRDTLHLFKFGPTLWEERFEGGTTVNEQGEWGAGPGTISVAFWYARPSAIQHPPINPIPTAGGVLGPISLREGKKTKDIETTVQFQSEQNLMPLRRDWSKTTHEPIAVLHLNYRSAYVLARKGHDVPLPEYDFGDEEETDEEISKKSRVGRSLKRSRTALDNIDQDDAGVGSSRQKLHPIKREDGTLIKSESTMENPILIEDEEEKPPVVIVLDD